MHPTSLLLLLFQVVKSSFVAIFVFTTHQSQKSKDLNSWTYTGINKMGLGKKVAAATFALGIGLSAGPVVAQDSQITTLAELNRAIAPGNLDPSRQTKMKRFDKDGDGIKETVGKLYFTRDGGRICVYSHNGVAYSMGYDSDRSRPFDYSRLATGCDGVFDKEIGTNEAFSPPSCSYLK